MTNFTTEGYCHKCQRQARMRLVRNITANGVSQVYWQCLQGLFPHPITTNGRFIPHSEVKSIGADPDDLPVINNYSGSELCAVCASPYAERHHFAPRHLFGDDAEKWPTAYLCKKHHIQWHALVTPNMGKPKNAWTPTKSPYPPAN